MKKRDLEAIGIPRGEIMDCALTEAIAAIRKGMPKKEILAELSEIIGNPGKKYESTMFTQTARAVHTSQMKSRNNQTPTKSAPFTIFGSGLDAQAIKQLEQACSLPIAVRGALMPDAHVGYGLPIGGVLATAHAVIPYAVGVDIACRMKLSVLDLPTESLKSSRRRLIDILQHETLFGVGSAYKQHRQRHTVMDRDWNVSPITAQNKDLAWSQLGTSGSGNHFVEFGILTLEHTIDSLGPGEYFSILSHSGSRGTGSKVASYFSKIAQRQHPELPRELFHLAWLDLDSREGKEYWAAMELMGAYAAANHELIHASIAEKLDAGILLDIENHHNFAWIEEFDNQPLVIHRKGATPASRGIRGIIPGSMGSPGFVVEGKGNYAALNSCSHGAGRKMSRSAALQQFSWKDAEQILRERDVTVLSAGIDELPMVYKDIEQVIDAQKDLVTVIARFDPKIVKMAPGKGRHEN